MPVLWFVVLMISPNELKKTTEQKVLRTGGHCLLNRNYIFHHAVSVTLDMGDNMGDLDLCPTSGWCLLSFGISQMV